MRNIEKRLLLFLLPLIPLGTLSGQTTLIDIYLSPDIHTTKVDTVSLNDPRLGQPTPVLDEAKAALGWHFADFTGEMDGYVQDAKIGKDLLPVDNTIIFATGSESSNALAVYKDGDNIEILDTGLWWHIQFSGGFPVYFILDAPPPLPAVTATAAPVIDEAPVLYEEAPVVYQDSPNEVITLPALPTSLETPIPGVIGQSYHGKFKRSKKQFGLFKPKAPYYLEDASGDRVAWIEVKDIVVPGSIKAFIDQDVVIHGERNRYKKDWIIQARNMRLK